MKQKDLYNKELNKIFTGFARGLSLPGALKSELNLYKKHLNFYLVGNSYYFIFNYHTLKCDFVSNEVEIIHGCKTSAFDLVAYTQKNSSGRFSLFFNDWSKYRKFFFKPASGKKIKIYRNI